MTAKTACPQCRCADALALQSAMAFRSPILVAAGIHRTSGELARTSLPEKSERSDDLQSGIGPWFRSLADDSTEGPLAAVARQSPSCGERRKCEAGPEIAISTGMDVQYGKRRKNWCGVEGR